MKFNDDFLHKLKALIEKIPADVVNKGVKSDDPSKLSSFLESCEKSFLSLMKDDSAALEGSDSPNEFAIFRYLLKSGGNELEKKYPELKPVLGFINAHLKLDDSLITDAHFQAILKRVKETGGYVGADGTLYGFKKYESLDPGWALAGIYYVLQELGIVKKYPFVKAACKSNRNIVTKNSVTIAVVGDWGTGPYNNADGVEAYKKVMDQISNKKPDYAIHLGDVYYAGTDKTDDIAPKEEINNLIDHWSPANATSFTLNSNHEMYSGAHGYFDDALKNSGLFTHQGKASYFSLEHKNWVLLGLDSAYYDKSSFFLKGCLQGADQLDFINKTDIKGKKIIVTTHHNAVNPAGTKPVIAKEKGSKDVALWDDMKAAFNGTMPDFWYWGHIHNVIAYSDKAYGANECVYRCVGQGAIPYAKGSDFYYKDGSVTGHKNPQIAYYGGQELPIPHLNKVELAKNGFVLLTLDSGKLVEEYYDQDGFKGYRQVHKF